MNNLPLENDSFSPLLNKIYKNNQLIIGKVKAGKYVQWILEDGARLDNSAMSGEIAISCSVCGQHINLAQYYWGLNKRLYRCQPCLKVGPNNPFYGKHHSPEFKLKHSQFMKNRFTGEKNHFYGKKHSLETRALIAKKSARYGDKNGFYGKKHSAEYKQRKSIYMKTVDKRPREYYVQMGIKSSSMPYRKTGIEKQVESFFITNNILYKYNFIIPTVGQFDFKVENFLVEVNGTYWHADPRVYGKDGCPLTERQKYKLKRDAEKKYAAEKLGFVVVYIWEEDIKRNCFDALRPIFQERKDI